MKSLFLLVLLVLTVACGRVGTGEVGILLSWDKQVQPNPIQNSVEITFLDEMYVVDNTQVRIPVTNVKAKDIDGILFQDIDAQVTYNTIPQGAVDFYKLTKELDSLEGFDNYVIGARVIEKESKNALIKVFTKFKASQVNTEKSSIEKALLEELTIELNKRFPNTFLIVDINIDSAQLDPNVEKVLQSQALLDSEKRTISSKMELQKKHSELLDSEIAEMKNTASKAGISVADLMKYKNDKEKNRVLSELARNGNNTQIQIKE